MCMMLIGQICKPRKLGEPRKSWLSSQKNGNQGGDYIRQGNTHSSLWDIGTCKQNTCIQISVVFWKLCWQCHPHIQLPWEAVVYKFNNSRQPLVENTKATTQSKPEDYLCLKHQMGTTNNMLTGQIPRKLLKWQIVTTITLTNHNHQLIDLLEHHREGGYL